MYFLSYIIYLLLSSMNLYGYVHYWMKFSLVQNQFGLFLVCFWKICAILSEMMKSVRADTSINETKTVPCKMSKYSDRIYLIWLLFTVGQILAKFELKVIFLQMENRIKFYFFKLLVFFPGLKNMLLLRLRLLLNYEFL